jgi:type II secretory ATPase GspE/PulE/Tfp pilus assembly ATPase PilB-like protein
MLAFGVAPHFLATALIGVVSQRLVRTFCPECRFPIAEEQGCSNAPEQADQTRFSALGCPACQYEGFGARTALFEILEVSPTIRKLIQNRETAQAIEEQAYRDGMVGFLQSGRALVARGLTNYEEIQRCIPSACMLGAELTVPHQVVS